MKIKKIIIENFRAFQNVEIEFNNFNCIIGENDSGKSTIFAALEWFFDKNKELDVTDFNLADCAWNEYTTPSYRDEISGEIIPQETIKEFIFDGFCASVTVYFEGVAIPKNSEKYDCIYENDFLDKDNCICICKYMEHPLSKNPNNKMGYYIQKYPFKRIGKIFSDCTIDELVNAYKELDENADHLCEKLNSLLEQRKKISVSKLLINAEIRNEKTKLRNKIYSELFRNYTDNGEEIMQNQWVGYNTNSEFADPFYLEWLDAYRLYIYTSNTPISSYLNAMFTPYKSKRVYKPIEDAKKHTALKLSEILKKDGINEDIKFKTNESINLFAENSMVCKLSDLPLDIPLTNRGEGLQLKIKNAIFRLLAEIQSKNQNCIFAFEEPETHLHPSAQIEMYRTTKKLSENPNYQVLMTTHSPYIVKELAKDNIKPIVIKRDDQNKKSYKSDFDEQVLAHDDYVSMNEINYIAFEEPTVEYHIELFGFMQNKLNKKVKQLDNWIKTNCSSILTSEDLFDWYNTETLTMEPNQMTLPYCVRNNIDHPLVDDVNDVNKHNAYENNKRFNDKELIRRSIEIMRNAIITHQSDFS